MSDVQMPEPVGWLHICRKKPTYRTFSFREKVKELAVLGYFPFPVITATQAQAYADARVREALEAAAKIADAQYDESRKAYETSREPYHEGAADASGFIESDIRALIPSAN